MGSSSKSGGKGKKRELSDHTITLRNRLHQALSLGIRLSSDKRKRWYCVDAEIQSHALRTIAAFINCISSSPLQHPLIKESVSDMLVALEGILRSENPRIVSQAADLTKKLVNSLGSSIIQYDILELVMSLSQLLPSCQLPVQIECAIALNCILKKLGGMSYKGSKEVWKSVEETSLVGNVVCALQGFIYGMQPIEYFIEMASLLRTIMWRWPPSRYYVGSSAKLMDNLRDNYSSQDLSITVAVLQLCTALALCGNGAMMLLESKELLSPIMQSMGTSQPYSVRIEALKLCQQLMRSDEGCAVLTSLYCEHIVEGIISAMGGWRSLCSNNIPSDQMPLVMQAYRTAEITRWSGSHHSSFWKLEIDRILLDTLLGNVSTNYQSQATVSSDELIAKLFENASDTRPYIWDILGWLAIQCEEDFVPQTKGKFCCLDVLISCACAAAKDLMLRSRSSLLPFASEVEPASRTVLFMVLSPSKYISSRARDYLSEIAGPDGDGYLEILLTSLNLIATGDVSLVSDSLQTAVSLIGLSCYSALPQYWKLIVQKKGIQTVSAIIERCLTSDIRVSRSSIVLHLYHTSEGKTCCWDHVRDWEGEDILLFYSLQSLSQLISFSNFPGNHYKITSREEVFMRQGDSEAHNLIDRLFHILSNNCSPGPRWYSAYILSFFGFYGVPSKLGKRMERALQDNEFVDLQFVLSNGQALKVHGAILAARCPYLLPPEETSLKGRKCDDCPMNKNESEQSQIKLKHEVRISDRVDYGALIKILEYTYTGFFLLEEDLAKPLKALVKFCALTPLSRMLNRKLPTWGMANPCCKFTCALERRGNPFVDIILEPEAFEEMTWNCSMCQLSMPHLHAHRIILSVSCDYLRALFQSGMHDSLSQMIKVPIRWEALVKLVTYFYSGELPGIKTDCIWNNMDIKQQLQELQAYVELSSLAEFWILEEVAEESLNVIVSCLNGDPKISVQIIHYAISLCQWKIVEVAVSSIAHLYPKIRDAGDLENLSAEVIEMLRAEYVRYSQKNHD